MMEDPGDNSDISDIYFVHTWSAKVLTSSCFYSWIKLHHSNLAHKQLITICVEICQKNQGHPTH